ncbi:TonB-dependent receptor [Psychrosphaera sp. F3M07]|jgi:iron complex outermembrane receptor protein|uniref:TonB-dependent receptor n=1 Tax=Psychrosphaera sp. F3M07 TaxID=2841560 RepID=UPI001C0999AB|nr:TonB-dependent receptor [Psychrosphaera sp. F3M07]MBU2916407.1 TonB-dependent receptor [Psychrosphaera sp. F3M07]
MTNKNIKITSLALAISTALASNVLVAAENDKKEKVQGLEVIEVTARKTAENIQKVPVAVTSLSASDLAEAGISTMTEVQQFSPNTTLQTSRGTNSTLTAFIRGVGQQDPLWGYEPGVGIYIDDVYMARPQGAVLDLLDVERIEVLRGPQGTLYGKNTIGGAVKYVTKEMSGDMEANAELTVGSYGQADMKLTGQVPVISDKLYVGFGYANLSRDGYGEFLKSAIAGQDKENYNKDLTAARLTLEYHASNDLFMRLAWDSTTDNSNAKGGYRLLPSILTDAPVPDSVFDSYTSMPTENLVELDGLSFMVNWDVNKDWSLKYVASSRESYSDTNIDFDNTDLDIFDVPAIYDDNNTSHELQANYVGDGFKLVSGVYLYDGESCGHFDAILGVLGRSLALPGLTREVTGCNNSTSSAVYAQGSFNLTDALSLTVGARYTNEEKEAYVNNGLAYTGVYPSSGWVPGYVRDPSIVFPQVLGTDTNGDDVLDAPAKADWSRFTPRLGVEYQMDADTMLFASYSQGFKSGTFNPRATVNEMAADPEIVDSLEFGIKKDWNNTLRTNITVFSIDHKDRQYITITPSPDDQTVLNQNLGNIKGSSVSGLEAEVTYSASADLTFNFALGLLDAKIEDDPTLVGELVGLSNTPDMTMNLSANYLIDSDLGYFVVTGGYYYRDDYILFEDSDLLSQEGYGMVNVGVNWESNEGNWYGGLYAKNLTDEEYQVGGYNFVADNGDGTYTPGLGGDQTLVAYYGDPMTLHLTVGYRF